MEQLIATFHIDKPLIIAQVINFAVVFVALYFFAIKPLLKMMNERSSTIASGLENALLSEEKIKQATQESETIIFSAKKDASVIVSTAYDTAKKEAELVRSAAEDEKYRIVQSAQDEIALHTKEAERKLQEESAGMVVLGMQKLFEGYVAEGKGEQLIKEIVRK